MSYKVFDFQKQKKVGDSGESEFVSFYKKEKPIKSKDRKIDFIIKSGRTIELKTDTYPMKKTENFFMELHSDSRKETLGGPWRALRDGVDFFVYYYQNDTIFFWFETKKLCNALDRIIKKESPVLKRVRNRGWDASGYIIPRDLLQGIELRIDTFRPKGKI
jgi:hypothetical protein